MDYGGAHSSHLKVKPANSKQKRVKFKIHQGSAENQDSPVTLSSSSSDSSSDDYFQVNPKVHPKFQVQNNNKPPLSAGAPKSLFYVNDDIDLSSKALYRLEESINGGSPGSTSRFSDITHESLVPQFSPTQSPPMQFMDKTGGFDLTRIPPSVFSKTSTPTEWSAASNDSLFSIRIGDGSFSRDRVSIEVLKPTELSVKRSAEGEGEKELIRFGPNPSPTFKGIEPYFDIEETISADPEEMRILDERIGDGTVKGSVNNNHVEMAEREIHIQHLVKPLRKKSSCLPCHCCDCFWALLCGCKWLSCLCKWPSCSFKWCVWPSCSGICSSCRCKCPELSSCCCECPNWSSCCYKCSRWSCCKCSSWSCCKCSSWSCCKCSSWSCCKCSSLSCCKCSSWSCCKCSSWSCCKCSSWSCCKCSSWSCCKCSSWSCCKCSSWSCCKCSSWSSCKCSSCSCLTCSPWSCCKCSSCSCLKCSPCSCFKCPSWSCCKCQFSNCTWDCCYCWDQERKTSSYDSPTTLADGRTTNSKHSTKASLCKRKSSCCSCSSSCSCCACWSCSCCC